MANKTDVNTEVNYHIEQILHKLPYHILAKDHPEYVSFITTLESHLNSIYQEGMNVGRREVLTLTRANMPFQSSDYRRGFAAGIIEGSKVGEAFMREHLRKRQEAEQKRLAELPKTRRKYLDTDSHE